MSAHARERGLTRIVVGPVHAGIIEPGRFTFLSGGEAIATLDVQLGFSHRDVEQRLIGADVFDAARAVGRICGACSASRSWGYARALEELAGLQSTEAVELARLVIAELERVYNHVFDLASACAGAGYQRGQMDGLRLKERVHRICDRHAGHRLLFDAIVPGGVRAGVLREPLVLRDELASLRKEIEVYGRSLLATSSLINRFEGAGKVSRDIAESLGAVGPTLRASGGNADVRVDAPYGAYKWLRPDVATDRDGDVHARVRVKFAELQESFRLLGVALGPLMHATIPEPTPFEVTSGSNVTLSEGPRGAEAIDIDIADSRIARIGVVSASWRNWLVVGPAMVGNIIPDFPLVSKSFNLCYACADR